MNESVSPVHFLTPDKFGEKGEIYIYFWQPPLAPLANNPRYRLGFKSWLAWGKYLFILNFKVNFFISS